MEIIEILSNFKKLDNLQNENDFMEIENLINDFIEYKKLNLLTRLSNKLKYISHSLVCLKDENLSDSRVVLELCLVSRVLDFFVYTETKSNKIALLALMKNHIGIKAKDKFAVNIKGTHVSQVASMIFDTDYSILNFMKLLDTLRAFDYTYENLIYKLCLVK